MAIATNFPSIKPSLLLDFANTKALDPRITFTRSTTATYYDGVTTAMAEQNLLQYSQEFDNGYWARFSTSVTANSSAAPDGTTTADLFYPASTGTDRWIYRGGFDTSAKTYSVYAKASGMSWMNLANPSGAGGGGVWFDLTNGVIGTISSGFTATITSVGGGWYRCSMYLAGSNGANFVIGVCDADNSRTATASGTNGILLWGAQLEQRSAATAYTPTTTQAITNYIPQLMTAASGVARFDHNPTTDESLGLLIEEQRTNILTYSAQFDNGAWGKDSGISVTANQAVAPDGTIAMDLMTRVPGSLNSWAQLTNAVSVGTGGNVGKTYSFSVWVQALPTAGTVSGVLTISDIFYNSYTQAFTATTTPTRVSIIASGGSGWNAAGSFIGAGISLNSDNTSVLVWGAQLEVGAFPTSYIPTVAATVTRNADAASMTGTNFSSWYSAAEGTIYSEWATTNLSTAFSMNLGTGSTNRIAFVENTNSSAVYANGIAQATFAFSVPARNEFTRNALAYKVNDFASTRNGAAVQTDTSGIVNAVSVLEIGSALNGTIKKIAYYPIRVTNANLQALTS